MIISIVTIIIITIIIIIIIILVIVIAIITIIILLFVVVVVLTGAIKPAVIVNYGGVILDREPTSHLDTKDPLYPISFVSPSSLLLCLIT